MPVFSPGIVTTVSPHFLSGPCAFNGLSVWFFHQGYKLESCSVTNWIKTPGSSKSCVWTNIREKTHAVLDADTLRVCKRRDGHSWPRRTRILPLFRCSCGWKSHHDQDRDGGALQEFGAELFDVLDETPQRGFMLEDWLRLMEPVVDIMPVEELVPLTPENKALPDSCYTSEAKSIVGVMAEEAEGLNSKTIGNAHVMALCMDPSGKAQKVLEMLDVDPHAVPAEIKELEECESMTPRHSFTSTSTCAPPERSGPTELEVSSEADQIEKPTDEVVVERLESGASHTGHYVPGMEQGPVTDEVQEGLVREPVLRAQQGRPPVLRAQQGARTLRYVGTTVWVHCEGRAARFFNIPAPKGAQSPKLALPTRVARLQLWCSAAAASNSNNSCCEPSVNGNIMMLGRRHGMTQTTTRSANWRSCPKISCLHCTSLSSE
eukprot:s822_g37.t3